MTTVTLTWLEVFHGACVGVMREIDARKKQRRTRFESRDSWGTNIEGACAELAVARLLGRYWHAIVPEPVGLPGDVGGYQVRSTPHDDGCLILYEHDAPGTPFILATGRAPAFTVRGWHRSGLLCRGDTYWRESAQHPAWFVPQSALIPLERLRGDAA